MNESAHALCWRAPAHCARRMRRVRGSFIATCCTCGESESVCLFCGVVSGVPVHDLCVWCVCVYVCIRRGTQRERPQNAQRAKPAGNGQKTRAGATRAQSAHTRGRDGPLRPTGRCVQSWVAHHGVRGGAPEEIFASKTIFRTKNAYSEDVKHLVQKLSSRPPRIWAHTTQHDVSRVVRLRQGQGGKAKGWPTWRAGMGSAGAGLAGGGAPWAGPAGHKPIQPAQR